MTPYELFVYLETQLKALTWTGGSNKIFGDNGVYIAPNFTLDQINRLPCPSIILNDGGGEADEENTLIFNQTIEAVIFVDHRGDVYGRSALMGGNRADATASPGAGLHQIEIEVLREFKNKQKPNVNISLRWKGAASPVPISGTNTMIYRTYRFQTQIHLYS